MQSQPSAWLGQNIQIVSRLPRSCWQRERHSETDRLPCSDKGLYALPLAYRAAATAYGRCEHTEQLEAVQRHATYRASEPMIVLELRRECNVLVPHSGILSSFEPVVLRDDHACDCFACTTKVGATPCNLNTGQYDTCIRERDTPVCRHLTGCQT